MKKKIIIFTVSLCILIIAVTVALVFIRKSKRDTENSGGVSKAMSTVKFFPGNEYNYPFGHWDELVDGVRYEVEIESQVTEGALIFSVYDTCGYDIEQKEKYELVRQEKIDASGNYVYDLSELPLKSYYFCIDAEDENVVASATYTFIRYRGK